MQEPGSFTQGNAWDAEDGGGDGIHSKDMMSTNEETEAIVRAANCQKYSPPRCGRLGGEGKVDAADR